MPATPAGQLDQRVEFQRATVARSALGGKTPGEGSWSPIGASPRRWAKVRWGSGAERRAAATEQGTSAATIRVRADSLTRTVTDRDRILHVATGLKFDITGIALIEAEIEFTGRAARG